MKRSRIALLAAVAALVLAPVPSLAIQQAKLVALDPSNGDAFGIASAISGDTAVVGASQDDHALGSNAGSAYVFTRLGDQWTQQQRLFAADAASNKAFGTSVAVSGDTVVVGSNLDDPVGPDSGSAYVFTRTAGVWTQQAKLFAADGAGNDQFGVSVAIVGDTILVGANSDDTAAGSDAGSAYVFTRTGAVWTQQANLVADDAAFGDNFGFSVSLSGDTALVGAHLAGLSNTGAAYVFTQTAGVWTQQAKLVADDAGAGDNLGVAVSVAGDTAVAGAFSDDLAAGLNAGSAYVFSRAAGVWTQQAKLTALDAAGGDEFGRSVAATEAAVVVGAPLDTNIGGAGAGSAYVFTQPQGTWIQQEKLVDSDTAAGDQLGISVAAEDNTAIAGATQDSHSGVTSAGSASVFLFDAEPPQTFILSGPPPLTPSTDATIEFLGTDDTTPGAALTFFCSLDGVPFAECETPAVYTGLAEGPHAFRVTSQDRVGNIDPSPATRTWTIDLTPPETTITSGPSGIEGTDQAVIHFVGTDNVTPPDLMLFLCSLDGAGFTLCDSPMVYTGLSGGSHTFRVAARDQVGHVDPSPASVTWTVDNTGPTVTFGTQENDVLVNVLGLASPAFGTATDDAAGVEEVSVTFTGLTPLAPTVTSLAILACNDDRTTCVWTANPPRMTGQYAITAQGTDALGNVGAVAGPVTVIVIGI